MKSLFHLTVMITSVILSACSSGHGSTEPPHSETNAVYYWKTSLALDSAEVTFIGSHDVGRIYLRMFDVSADRTGHTPSERAIPNATVRVDFQTSYLLQNAFSVKEFVPVVYITLDALKAMQGDEDILASNIVTRVRNMIEYNYLPNVSELQLDCDWTASTEASFFTICNSVRHSIDSLCLPWRLGSTIRLHQLARKAPPVDNGVLMVYNTGNFNDPDARNSIIDAADIAPYLRHLPSYPLHLDIAYPTYSWQLLFRDRKFVGLMQGVNLSDTAAFARRDANLYVARRDIPWRDMIIRAGDMVRLETSEAAEIFRVKAMIESRLAGRPHSNILYHLDTNNLSNYSSDEIDDFFSTGH